MTEQTAAAGHKVGKPMSHNWVEERAKMESVTTLKAAYVVPKSPVVRLQGIRGELLKKHTAQMIRSAGYLLYLKCNGLQNFWETRESTDLQPTSMCFAGLYLRKYFEKIRADLNPQTPKTEYCSTTQKDFCVEGFVPFKPETTRVHDYKTDQAITFWSENCQRIQGVTAARSSKGPFRKSALFSTPITERLDEIDLPPDN
ncbi:sperm associated antigen 8 isoform X1 [Oreochromis aureus]|uniref:Uncharacterized protein n=1 Tax=Oreochromis aureus TaxID=47969 RepID=A0AAZ1X7Q6_OREAU|nr:sperm associated antigen 8 isoform X1 [Oreochromis aureus]